MDERLEPLGFLHFPVWMFDVEALRIIWANDCALQFWGADSLVSLQQRDMSDGMSLSVHKRLQQYQADCTHYRESYTELWTLHPNDQPQSAEVVFSPFMMPDGRDVLMIHLLNETPNVDSGTLHSTQALMHTSAMISMYSSDLQLIYSNPAARSIATREGMSLDQHLLNAADLQTMKQLLKDQGNCELECQVQTIEGVAWHAMNIQLSPDSVTGSESILVSATDITARREAQQQAVTQAYTDSLTGLPNRMALLENVTSRISYCTEHQSQFALIFLDLDRFKLVNDSLGHAVGDALLQAFAARLSQCVKTEGSVARLGGDEFVVIVRAVEDRDEVAELAELLKTELSEPVVVAGHKLRLSPSMGICLYPDDGDSATTLMQHADVAMYDAKARNCGYRFFEPLMGKMTRNRLELETDLAAAIDEEQFELYYQPKIDANTGQIIGAEALLRWIHPERGMVSPLEFISITEETGMILALGRWVMEQAVRDLVRWQEQGYQIPVSINISPKQFLSPEFIEHFVQLLTDARIEPGMIDLEITESVLIADQDLVLDIMEKLNQVGVKFSLDDFGTGYSNLAYLQKYPLDCLKIDRSFLRDMNETALLELVLGMGELMRLRVVAEGVETAEHIRWLQTHGCDELQGFYFSKPLPMVRWLEFIRDYRPFMQAIALAA